MGIYHRFGMQMQVQKICGHLQRISTCVCDISIQGYIPQPSLVVQVTEAAEKHAPANLQCKVLQI